MKAHKITSKNLFFNHILGLSLEAYMEFYINGLMNLQTADYSTNGEWIGMLLSYFTSIMIHGVLPLLLLYLQTLDLNKLKSEKLQSYIGVLYTERKYKTKFQLAYTLMFIIRRGIFLTLGMFILNSKLGGVQICCLQMLNLLAIIYIGMAKA